MIQKHISSKHLNGLAEISKKSLADISDLIRLSPTSCRVLLLLVAYADEDNSIITDVKTISYLLGIEVKKAEYAIRNLIRNGYIDMTEVKLDHSKDIIGVTHDKKLYYKSHKKVWKVVGDILVTTYKVTGTYNRFYINESVIKCNGESHNNILKHMSGNLFYDSTIPNNEIIWEM